MKKFLCTMRKQDNWLQVHSTALHLEHKVEADFLR